MENLPAKRRLAASGELNRGQLLEQRVGAASRRELFGRIHTNQAKNPRRDAAPTVCDKKWRSRPISRVLSWTVIPLGATSPLRSSNLPGDTAGRGIASLFGLAPGGVCRAGPLPDSRCALTAPFHPCRPTCVVLGGIFLLHFPSACAAQALPGTVPCGARTFLGIHHASMIDDATVWPAPPCALSHATDSTMRRR